jgi:DNA polymerase III epsilon subunit-like protein
MLFATFDTETTGLPFHRAAPLESQPRIIEFGGIITDGNDIIEEFTFICNPGIAIEAIITDITGLTNDDLKDKPPFKHFIPQVQEFFSKADAVIAHNASFDTSMVEFDCRRVGKALSDVSYPDLRICTVEQTTEMFGKNMRLIDLYERYVEQYVQKHRALDDVICLHKLCKVLGIYNMFEGQQ